MATHRSKKKTKSKTGRKTVSKKVGFRKTLRKARVKVSKVKRRVRARKEITSVFSMVPAGSSSTRIFARTTPLLRLESTRKFAYYGVGTMALLGGLTFLITQSVKDSEAQRIDSRTELASAFEFIPEKPTQTVSLEGTGKLLSDFERTKPLSLEKRIDYWSSYIEKNQKNRERLLQLSFGHRIEDIEPIVPKQYDCTTFVETVAALAFSEKPDDFFEHLMAIRYKDANPTYFARNHFPEADWIPNNERKDLLSDITSRVAEGAGLTAKVETKTIDRATWEKNQIAKDRQLRGLAMANTFPGVADAHLSYIPISEIENVIDQLPNGAVVNFVHKNDNAHPVLITHQGFIIKNGNRVMIRHSSRNGHIRTNEFIPYLKNLAGQAKMKNPNWPLIGVNFNRFKGNSSEYKEGQGFKQSKVSSSETKRRKASM